jgi:alpha-D-xyloside xylohydrolase
MDPQIDLLGHGVWRVRFGTPEAFTPHAVRERAPAWEALKGLADPGELPFELDEISADVRSSRTVVRIPCDEPESSIYGFGLDPGALEQKGLRKWLSVSAHVVGETGASHGPVPFYVSTRGYGVYVDTARVPFVHVARLSPAASATASEDSIEDAPKNQATSESELYGPPQAQGGPQVVFDLPGNSSGVDVFVFAGPSLREAVQRYNLFSGGGCLPPMWGLGQKYRTHSGAQQEEVRQLAQSFRDNSVPCDMFGLEPGWQTHAYSCSLVWSPERFPEPHALTRELAASGFRLNLWEHAYIHPTSPLFGPLRERAGDYLVWDGLVVDFADPKAAAIFADYHEQNLIQHGVTAFKADECDRQHIADVTPFNYPYCSAFPSGIDGDQMTQLYGYLYQRSIYSVFKRRDVRTLGDVRGTTALAAPLPFCLYSDAYSFDEYLRQLINASFSGLLWSPEVRQADTQEELLNRIGMASLAPQMCLNIWFMPHPVWEQYQHGKNVAHELLPEEEQQFLVERIRAIVNVRMSLIPYLYACFHRYCTQGLPPVRALILEFPDDPQARAIDNQFMFGDLLMAAPLPGAEVQRTVYFPAGCDWVDFHSRTVYPGGSSHLLQSRAGDVPLFVKANALLPVATPVQHVARDTVFEITVQVYGETPQPFVLFEDDGESFAYERGEVNTVTLAWSGSYGTVTREGSFSAERFRVSGWEPVAVQSPD